MKLKEKIKMHSKKVMVGIIGVVTMLQMQVTPAFADANGALSAAKDDVINQVKPIVNGTVVPVLLVLLVAATVFAIFKAVMSYRKGREVELGWVIGLVIGITLVAIFPTWGWQLIS